MVKELNMEDQYRLKPTFLEELVILINKHNIEKGSDTPDYILADYLNHCITVLDGTIKERSRWYGHEQSENSIQSEMRFHPPTDTLVNSPVMFDAFKKIEGNYETLADLDKAIHSVRVDLLGAIPPEIQIRDLYKILMNSGSLSYNEIYWSIKV
jgi:hypothetical protein